MGKQFSDINIIEKISNPLTEMKVEIMESNTRQRCRKKLKDYSILQLQELQEMGQKEVAQWYEFLRAVNDELKSRR